MTDDPMYEVPLSRLKELTARASATAQCTRPPEGWACSRGANHDGPCAARPTTAQGTPSPAGPERSAISVEERRLLIVDAVEKLKERGVLDISMNAIVTTLDATLEKLGVKVVDEIYVRDGTEDGEDADASDGMPVCPHCGGQGVEFMTDEERGFFAYMASQRWRTVAEKDMRLAEAKRARWQVVAQWFDPTWKPE